MEEFELLDFLFVKTNSIKVKELRHFILKPFKEKDRNSLILEKYYFNSMGIDVIPYYIGVGDYGILFDVVSAWNKIINNESEYLPRSLNRIEYLATNYPDNEDEIEELLQLIKDDKPQEDYFFKILSKSQKPQFWLKRIFISNYFDPKNNPLPQEAKNSPGYFHIPYWNVLGFLENVANKNRDAPSDEIDELLQKITSDIIRYKTKSGEKIDNPNTDASIVKVIFSRPSQKINEEHFVFLKNALKTKWHTISIATAIRESVIPNLILKNAKDHLLIVLDIVIEKSQSNVGRPNTTHSIIGPYWLKIIIDNYARSFSQLCGNDATWVVLNKISKIVAKDTFEFNSFEIPAIEQDPEKFDENAYSVQIIRLVRILINENSSQMPKNEVERLLNEKHPIFNRIAIFLITHNYNSYGDLLLKIDYNPLSKSQLDHEMLLLLKTHSSVFCQEHIDHFLEWINDDKSFIPKKTKRSSVEIKNTLDCIKRKWISALLPTQNEGIIQLYEKYNVLCPSKEDEDDQNYASFVEDISPLSEDEILEMSNEELLEFIMNFKENGEPYSPTVDGLSNSLKNCVKIDPKKFLKNLDSLLLLTPQYQLSLISGFNEFMKENPMAEERVLLSYLNVYINSDFFWIFYDRDNGYGDCSQIVIEVTRFIEHYLIQLKPGLVDLESIFSDIEAILFTLEEKVRPIDEWETKQVPRNYVTPQTSVFNAIFSYSIKIFNINKENGISFWSKRIIPIFNKRIFNPKERTCEFSLSLGKFLPAIYFFNKEWLVENIDSILPNDNSHVWSCTFTGYLKYAQLRFTIYKLFKTHEDYRRAISYYNEDNDIRARLIGHICIGYVNGLDPFGESTNLISQVIYVESDFLPLLINSIHYMNRRQPLDDFQRERVKTLWKIIFEKIAMDLTNVKNQKLISDLFEWVSIFNDIDNEIFEWLKISVKYLTLDHGSPFFTEYLASHVEKNPDKVAELLIININSGNTYPYDKDDIQKIVEELFRCGLKGRATTICNLYLSNGETFLQEIYDQYRSPQ
jgi:hypothetical protein